MFRKSSLVPCALWLFVGLCAPSQADAPACTLVQAEADPHGAVQEDPAALGGAFVEQDGGYQPTVIAPLPKTGDSWVIWARIKGVNLQLKAIGTDGAQKELNWEWTQPDEWTWISFGRHTRAELGAQILLMRGPTASGKPGVDAVLFASDDAFDPETGIPAPKVTLAPVGITVDWSKTVAHTGPLSYGLNAFGGFDPKNTTHAAYNTNLAFMHAGLIRLHNWGMMADSKTDGSGWIDTAAQTWDAAKIRAALADAYPYGPKLLINIPAWPAWMDKDHDGFLDTDQQELFAQFCAALVKIVNKDLKKHVLYWEVTNEQDGRYYGDFHDNGGALKDAAKPDRLAELATIYTRCAVAMKSVDPSIQVGGPAVARPDWTDAMTRFAQATAPHLDFFSYHAYASGSKDDSDRQIFDRAVFFGAVTKTIVAMLAQVSPKRPIPAIFDEYNISWTWETRDPRMTDVKGAIFDALTMVSAVTNHADATVAWNEKDGIYGKMDDAYVARPSSHIFHLFNTYLQGECVSSQSADPTSVVAFAVTSAGNRRSLLLINRSKHDQTAVLTSSGGTPSSAKGWRCAQLTGMGYEETPMPGSHLGTAPIPLPAFSVTLFTTMP